MVTKVGEANQIELVIYYSIENSMRELTKASRSNDLEPMVCVILLLESSPPVELEMFWAFSKNKKELQIWPH